jgi:hypothetical protein
MALNENLQNIGRLLRTQFGEIANEPLPARWGDLIKSPPPRARLKGQETAREVPPHASLPRGTELDTTR